MGNLLIKNLAYRQRHNALTRLRKKSLNFAERVDRESECEKKALRPVFPHHHRLKRIDVRPSRLVFLLDLNGIPRIHKLKLSLRRFFGTAETG